LSFVDIESTVDYHCDVVPLATGLVLITAKQNNRLDASVSAI